MRQEFALSVSVLQRCSLFKTRTVRIASASNYAGTISADCDDGCPQASMELLLALEMMLLMPPMQLLKTSSESRPSLNLGLICAFYREIPVSQFRRKVRMNARPKRSLFKTELAHRIPKSSAQCRGPPSWGTRTSSYERSSRRAARLRCGRRATRPKQGLRHDAPALKTGR